MRDALTMRTTLDIDDQLLQAAKEIASYRRTTLGRVVSDLMQKALEPPQERPRVRNGVPLLPPLPPGSPPITMKMVNELRDAE